MADKPFTTKRAEDETDEIKTKRLFLLALESMEKYGASAGFNLKDALPGEVMAFWRDHKFTISAARNSERTEKAQKAAESLATSKANDAIKAALSPNEMRAYQRANQSP